MLLINRDEIKKVFSMAEAVEANKECYMAMSRGEFEIPQRTVISGSSGNYLFMPSYSEKLGAAGLKIVNIMPGNPALGLPASIGQVLLIDGKTGRVSAMMDGTYITAIRTAAASGAAFDLLGKKDAAIGALIGTGSQAMSQLEAMLTVRNLKEVRVAARDFEKTKRFVEEAKSRFKPAADNSDLESTAHIDQGLDGIRHNDTHLKDMRMKCTYSVKNDSAGSVECPNIIACKDANAAVDGADLITLVTTATKPVCSADNFKQGAVISAVGAYTYDMQELDPAVFKKCSKIYFDSEEAVLSESGDILRPLDEGILTKEQFTGDIGDCLLGKIPGRESDDEIIVFENVGVGALDLYTAQKVYDAASAVGIGTTYDEA